MTEISVIMPVYNREHFLPETLSSVREQTFKDWELICVNDGSNDASADFLESNVRQDKRIRVIHQRNAGVSAARNRGMQSINGRYFTFLDSDDAIIQGYLQCAHEAILYYSAPDLIVMGLTYVPETTNWRAFQPISTPP